MEIKEGGVAIKEGGVAIREVGVLIREVGDVHLHRKEDLDIQIMAGEILLLQEIRVIGMVGETLPQGMEETKVDGMVGEILLREPKVVGMAGETLPQAMEEIKVDGMVGDECSYFVKNKIFSYLIINIMVFIKLLIILHMFLRLISLFYLKLFFSLFTFELFDDISLHNDSIFTLLYLLNPILLLELALFKKLLFGVTTFFVF